MKIYLANDLFSEQTLAFNEMLYTKMVEMGFEVYAPQKNTAINDKSKCADSVAIYDGDTEKLVWCDILVAVLDGPVADPGVAAEVGWVAGWNASGGASKKILALYTDTRDGYRTSLDAKNEMMKSGPGECQYSYLNLYVGGAVKKYGKICSSSAELFDALTSLLK